MGLTNEESKANVTYVGTYDGNFTTRTTAEDPQAHARELKKGPNAGKTIYEQQFNTLSGRLEDIRVEASDYGKQWKFVLDDKGELFQLSFPYTSRNADEMLFRLPNINLDMEIEIKIFLEPEHMENGKKWPARNVIWMRQNDIKVPMVKKAEWQGLPELQKVTINGEERNDSTARMQFMEEWVTANVLDKLNSFNADEPIADVTASQEQPEAGSPPAYLSDELDQNNQVEPQQPPLPNEEPGDSLPF